jgi:hypothetical protein
MMSKKHETAMRKVEEKMSYESRVNDLNRARSVTVGTCFGGTTEVMMRGNDGSVLWTPMQPVEVIELIHQLAANVGCHIHLQPRQDFSSWRGWKITEEERLHLGGHPPFSNDMAPFNQVGIRGAVNPQISQGVGGGKGGDADSYLIKEEQKDVMAIKKTVDKRSTKRASKAS